MSQELVDGRFRVGQVIGRDNMGEVHRADDLHAPESAWEDQRRVVAQVASTLFGTKMRPEHVIGEILVRATREAPDTVPAERLTSPAAPRAYDDLVHDPLARWIESRFGLVEDQEPGRLVRQRPAKIEIAAKELSERSGVPEEDYAAAIRATLVAGSQARHPLTELVFRGADLTFRQRHLHGPDGGHRPAR